MYFTVWEEPDPVHYRLERGRPMYFTVWGGEPAPVLYHLGGAESCTVPWEVPANVLDRMGGAGSGTVPLGRSRLKNFTVWEEPAPVLYHLGWADSCTVPWEVPATVLDRMGGAGSGTLPLGRSRLRYFTVWEEPALVLYRLQDRWLL